MLSTRKVSSTSSQQRSYARPLTGAEVALEMEKRQAGRERLIPFCQYKWDGFETRPYRELIAGGLEMVESKEISRLMVFAPPQFGKSTLVTHEFPQWYLGRNPDDRIILCSYNADLAQRHSRQIRDGMRAPAYSRLFGAQSPFKPPVELHPKSQSTEEWSLHHHRGGMKAAGVGGGIAGYPGKLILLDDPVKDDDEAQSLTIQERNIEWYGGAVYSRLAPGSAIVLIMTRWNERDLAGYLLEQQAFGGDLWHVLRLTALAESPEQIKNWCERNNITPDRYITADFVGKRRTK